jgi:hypothetical protein
MPQTFSKAHAAAAFYKVKCFSLFQQGSSKTAQLVV